MAYVDKLFNTNFLEYASYVIKDRAIPHIDDGLKPVQRRILHSLLEIDDGKFHKVANVVGHCMKYHPHGDASIGSALVVLANKDLFIEKQGNFGNNFTGDEASAARYIECRALPFAKKILYNPELTEYVPSYDGRNKEPVVFPAKIPVILVQGAEGIAVGMSTKILPHNIIEVLQAVKDRLRGQRRELLPDFPTGGLVDASAYDEGMGSVLVRAKIDTSDPKRLVIRELPFGTTTESLIASIENAARKGKIKVGSINDYTTEKVEIEIQLQRGVYTQDVVDALYAFTDCEQSISVNLLVIKDGLPVAMKVSEVIDHHARQLQAILKKELKIELGHLQDRLHARTLERIFIEERLYKRIEDKDTQEKVKYAVLTGFEPFMDEIKREITDDDLERLLKIPIRRISLYDINKAKREVEEILARIKEVKAHLKDIVSYAEAFLDGIISGRREEFPRLTEITSFSKVEARSAAARNLNLRYDDKTGYLGYQVSGGKSLFEVSEFDRVLIIKKDGSYSVHPVSEKQFFGSGVLNVVLADKDELAGVTHTIIYRNEESKQLYIKRTVIEKYIMEKNYDLVPDRGKLLAYTTRTKGVVHLTYKPKPNLRVLEEGFPIEDYLVKGTDARGVRLSTKEVKKIRISAK
jgi:topoisomerase-4 subunit A